MQFIPKIREKETRLKAVDVWKRRFIENHYRDNSLRKVSREYNFYGDSWGTYSGKDRIATYFTVDGLPSELPISFIDDFREVVSTGVLVNKIDILEPTKIDWKSPSMVAKLNTWARSSSTIDSKDVSEFTLRENISLLDENEKRKRSLVYLSGADIRRRRRLFKYRSMIIVEGDRGIEYDESVDAVVEMAEKLGLVINQVTGDFSTFLRGFSPTSAEYSGKLSKLVGNTVIPDEIVSRFNTFDQGKIGERGVYIGTDVYSGYPVFKVFKEKDTSPENITITAETGWGKSVNIKEYIQQLLADDRFVGTIMDIEGFEYAPLGKFVGISDKVVTLNMSKGVGSYYDPVEIVKTGLKSLDDDMFNLSSSYTKSLMKVLIGDLEDEEKTWVSSILSEVVSRAYLSKGVSAEEPNTWARSQGMDLHYVYKIFKLMYDELIIFLDNVEKGEVTVNSDNKFMLNKKYLNAYDKIASSLRTYFEDASKGGIKSNYFKERINLKDIVDSKLLICSFGLAGRSGADIDEVELALSQSYAAIMAQIRSLFTKAKGKYNFKVWEEFQRWGEFEGSAEILNSSLTGGRKLGDVNFIVTNRISELLRKENNFGVFDNTTSFIIGAIDDANVRRELCERLSIEDLQPELDKLIMRHKVKKEGLETSKSIYDHAFLIKLDRADVSLIRVELPEEVIDSEIFRAGVDRVESEGSNG